jgi:hypothetical protein
MGIMNRRSILMMTAVGMIGFCAGGIARADEVLKFRLVMHATSVQTQEVGDVDGHVVGVGRYSGQKLRAGLVAASGSTSGHRHCCLRCNELPPAQ